MPASKWDDEEDEDELKFQHAQRRHRPGHGTTPKRQRTEPFVQMPLWWAETAAKATKSPATLVLVELLHRHWKTSRLTFSLPNGRLSKLGASRKTKTRVLRELERAGLIKVDGMNGKTPIVTLLLL
jgi:DNA-binding HxlR family transcriptional regulator